MGVAFGLAAALLWGTADYLAAVASRRSGSFRVVLGFHLIAVAMLAILVVATGTVDDVSAADAVTLLWVGALGALSYATFYRSLEIGPISIASPIISAYAAVSLVLAVLVLDETLTGGQIVAAAVVLLGVLLASADLAQLHRIQRRQAIGILLAIVTAIAIGAFVFGNAYYAIDLGWLMPIFLSRGFATLFLLLAATRSGAWRLDFAGRTPSWFVLVAILAALDTGGYAVFNLGAERAETSIVSAASAPYAVIPIVAGVLFLHERPRPVQWLGVAGVVGGVVLLGVYS
ncbi:MAG: DMT family transporter [Gaiellales bacterium]